MKGNSCRHGQDGPKLDDWAKDHILIIFHRLSANFSMNDSHSIMANASGTGNLVHPIETRTRRGPRRTDQNQVVANQNQVVANLLFSASLCEISATPRSIGSLMEQHLSYGTFNADSGWILDQPNFTPMRKNSTCPIMSEQQSGWSSIMDWLASPSPPASSWRGRQSACHCRPFLKNRLW